MKTYIVYHSNCTDGFGAAYSAWKRFGSTVEYIPMSAGGKTPTFEPRSTIFFLDVAPNTKAELLELMKNNEVYIIDHHEKNIHEFIGIKNCIFDMSHSGCYLAWKYFNPTLEVPKFIEYIEKKDLFKFSAIDALIIDPIYSIPFDFLTWEACLENGFDAKVFTEQGIAIGRNKEFQMNLAMNGLHTLKIGEYFVPAINTKENVSELANRLCTMFPEAPFAVCYSVSSGGQYSFSLRSTGFNVNHLAMKFGGGGHPKASGFRIPVNVLDFYPKEETPTGFFKKYFHQVFTKWFGPVHGEVCICEEDKYKIEGKK